jgi:hypothetical protein
VVYIRANEFDIRVLDVVFFEMNKSLVWRHLDLFSVCVLFFEIKVSLNVFVVLLESNEFHWWIVSYFDTPREAAFTSPTLKLWGLSFSSFVSQYDNINMAPLPMRYTYIHVLRQYIRVLSTHHRTDPKTGHLAS